MTMTGALTFDRLRDLTGGRLGEFRVVCPVCGPSRSTKEKKQRKVLKIWRNKPDFVSYACGHCDLSGYAADARSTVRIDPQKLARLKTEAAERQHVATADRLKVVLKLWRRRLAIPGTIAERYLRDVRGYGGPIPATLGFLPATDLYPPAMIAAFGVARETFPGELAIDDGAVRGIHLTKLKADGSGKADVENAKVMIGKSTGYPIVLAPINDGLGLAIAEGIEDALSLHEATGLGVWAAGSANRLPALADRIPSYVEIVNIAADDDKDGLKYADQLGQIVLRSRECRIWVP